MTTTTDLSAERAILHWAADRLAAEPNEYPYGADQHAHVVGLLRRWADELAPAPKTWALPPEPGPEVTELWDRDGWRWELDAAEGGWVHEDTGEICIWSELLAEYGPLSTVEPEETEASS
jgi:hypothetical protein